MGFADSFMTFIGIASIPYYAPWVVTWVVAQLGFGFMGEMVMGYAVPFVINWIFNFFSEYMYNSQNCKGKASMNALIGVAFIPTITTLILSVVLNFVPILKAPFLILAVFGGMWIAEVVINIVGNYGLGGMAGFAARKGIC